MSATLRSSASFRSGRRVLAQPDRQLTPDQHLEGGIEGQDLFRRRQRECRRRAGQQDGVDRLQRRQPAQFRVLVRKPAHAGDADGRGQIAGFRLNPRDFLDHLAERRLAAFGQLLQRRPEEAARDGCRAWFRPAPRRGTRAPHPRRRAERPFLRAARPWRRYLSRRASSRALLIGFSR